MMTTQIIDLRAKGLTTKAVKREIMGHIKRAHHFKAQNIPATDKGFKTRLLIFDAANRQIGYATPTEIFVF